MDKKSKDKKKFIDGLPDCVGHYNVSWIRSVIKDTDHRIKRAQYYVRRLRRKKRYWEAQILQAKNLFERGKKFG